jgi:hypothetical protein
MVVAANTSVLGCYAVSSYWPVHTAYFRRSLDSSAERCMKYRLSFGCDSVYHCTNDARNMTFAMKTEHQYLV